MQVNIFIAFFAGLVSFFAPCVVPLVPAYLSYISGVSVSELESSSFARYRAQILVNSLFYIAGFSLVFVLLGLGAAAIGQVLVLNRALLVGLGFLMVSGKYDVFNGYILGKFGRFFPAFSTQ